MLQIHVFLFYAWEWEFMEFFMLIMSAGFFLSTKSFIGSQDTNDNHIKILWIRWLMQWTRIMSGNIWRLFFTINHIINYEAFEANKVCWLLFINQIFYKTPKMQMIFNKMWGIRWPLQYSSIISCGSFAVVWIILSVMELLKLIRSAGFL